MPQEKTVFNRCLFNALHAHIQKSHGRGRALRGVLARGVRAAHQATVTGGGAGQKTACTLPDKQYFPPLNRI